MNYKHGYAKIGDRNKSNPKWRAHVAWLSMKARCLNESHKDFQNWGGRGITVDDRWMEFANFLEDMGEPPLGSSLDRIDNDKNYCKENCRWASRKEQNRNKRSNRYLEFNGERRMIVEWAEHLGVKPRLLRVRLNRGWSVEETLTTPLAA